MSQKAHQPQGQELNSKSLKAPQLAGLLKEAVGANLKRLGRILPQASDVTYMYPRQHRPPGPHELRQRQGSSLDQNDALSLLVLCQASLLRPALGPTSSHLPRLPCLPHHWLLLSSEEELRTLAFHPIFCCHSIPFVPGHPLL